MLEIEHISQHREYIHADRSTVYRSISEIHSRQNCVILKSIPNEQLIYGCVIGIRGPLGKKLNSSREFSIFRRAGFVKTTFSYALKDIEEGTLLSLECRSLAAQFAGRQIILLRVHVIAHTILTSIRKRSEQENFLKAG